MNEELYLLLGVEKTASEAEIRRAYRNLAKIHHPDASGDADAFVRLTLAYNTLMDPKLREEYDLSGNIVEENALNVQRGLIESLANLFQGVLLQLQRPVKESDIVKMMKADLAQHREEKQHAANIMSMMLRTLHEVRDRIKPKDMTKENTFLMITDAKIKEISADYKQAQSHLRVMDRVGDVLEQYDSVVEIVRTSQWGASSTAFGSSGGFFTINWPVRT